MDLKSGELSCVRCKAYLFNEDDVVYCPVCGAPHHRECYNALGHCALEELHGTEKEYSKIKTEEKKQEFEEKKQEPKLDTSFYGRMGAFSEFDFLGGVPADYDLGDGVTADEAKNFVVANTHRYIPKFAVLNQKNRISWNWIAFLFPAGWMFSRKMYKGGSITALLTIAANCLSYPLSLKLYNLGFDTSGYLAENLSGITAMLPQIGLAVILLALAGTFFDLGIRLVAALFGDYIYKNHMISNIKKIKEESTDQLADYRKKGGTNLLLFFLGTFIVQYGYAFVTFFLR